MFGLWPKPCNFLVLALSNFFATEVAPGPRHLSKRFDGTAEAAISEDSCVVRQKAGVLAITGWHLLTLDLVGSCPGGARLCPAVSELAKCEQVLKAQKRLSENDCECGLSRVFTSQIVHSNKDSPFSCCSAPAANFETCRVD